MAGPSRLRSVRVRTTLASAIGRRPRARCRVGGIAGAAWTCAHGRRARQGGDAGERGRDGASRGAGRYCSRASATTSSCRSSMRPGASWTRARTWRVNRRSPPCNRARPSASTRSPSKTGRSSSSPPGPSTPRWIADRDRRAQPRRHRRSHGCGNPVARRRRATARARGRGSDVVDHGSCAPAGRVHPQRGRSDLGCRTGPARSRAGDRRRDREARHHDESHARAARVVAGPTAAIRL